MMKASVFALSCFLAVCVAGSFSLSAEEDTETKQGAVASVDRKLPDSLSKPVFTPSLRDDLSETQFQDEKKAAGLIEQRELTLLKMHQTRKYILNNDTQAKELYKQMMEIAARLTVVIENKKSMRDLNRTLKKLDDEIAELPKKEKSPEIEKKQAE